jgi:uncharacterized damage-inducible protein DinB
VSILQHFRRQFEYEFWANREEIRTLSGVSDPAATAVRILAHVMAAQWLWLDRLQKHPARIAVWADLTLPECGAQLQELEAAWRSYLAALTEDDLSTSCDYTNSKGEVWRNSVADVVSHVLLHSAYHRGQIALEIRRSGNTPAYTDYIHAVRQGLLA